MIDPLQAKPTFYNGYWMRSTLEARWAKLLDVFGIDYRYELRRFVTAQGPYLPDFYLPELQAWLEIKPYRPSEVELAKLRDVAASDNTYAFLVSGFPNANTMGLDGEYVIAWRGSELCVVKPNRKVVRLRAERLLSFYDSSTRLAVARAVQQAGASSFGQGFLKISEALVLTGHQDWYEWNAERNRQRDASAEAASRIG